ncbi:MAG: GNAT family N-acetyltransferase [Bacteroidales bacterium]|nr:GNAT family N-acetyltransferase [Bacteroidales bacterium]
MTKIIKATFSEIASFRKEYFHSLAEFQELYLELMMKESAFYLLEEDGALCGYFIITKDNTMIEFFLREKYIPEIGTFFMLITNKFKISRVLCKSFDSLLLKCCLSYSISYKLVGNLFRDLIPASAYPMTGVGISFAEKSDYDYLLSQQDGLYESPEELETFIEGRNLLMYKMKDLLIGCGFLIRIHADWPYYDIGMWVHPEFRKQGIATQIISHLKEECIKNNWKPICGCASENLASQKTLEKNGFICKHHLVEFVIS